MKICNKQFLIDNRWPVKKFNVLNREQLITLLSQELGMEDRCPILTI